MKKILMVLVILTMFLSAQIFRHSESGIKQRKIEYTQGGVLLRFDFKQVERIDMDSKSLMWKYQEFWIPLDMELADIQKLIGEKGYKLTDDDIKTLVIGKVNLYGVEIDSVDIADIADMSEKDFNELWLLLAVPIVGIEEAIRRWLLSKKVKV